MQPDRVIAGFLAFALAFFPALAFAQSPMRAFPPGMFQNRAALDAAGAPPGYTGPGDVVSSAKAWWGLRAYSSATKGNRAINVCNVADATCADLNTDATTGALVVTTIGGSSCSVVVCTVKIIYDQTGANSCGGAACDISQTTIGNRAILTVSCVSSLPCLTFASGKSYTKGSFVTQAQPYTISASIQQTSAAAVGTYFTVSGKIYLSFNTTPAIGVACTTGQNVTSVVNTWYAIQSVCNGASSAVYINGSSNSISPGTTGISSTDSITVGTDEFAENFVGTITEFGFWGSAFSAGNQSSMNSNQRSYWGF